MNEDIEQKKENGKAVLLTNHFKKSLLVIGVPSSAYLNVMLLSKVGYNAGTVIVFSFIAIGLLFFQTYAKRAHSNTKSKKKRAKYMLYYIVCTAISISGTVGSGYNGIKKTSLDNIESTTRIKAIDRHIALIENREDVGAIEAIKDKLSNTGDASVWGVNTMIKRSFDIENSKIKDVDKIEELENEKAALLKSQTGVQTSINGLSEVTRIDREATTFVLLCLCAILLEFMIYEGATFTGKFFNFFKLVKNMQTSDQKKNNKAKRQSIKEKRAGQVFMEMRGSIKSEHMKDRNGEIS